MAVVEVVEALEMSDVVEGIVFFGLGAILGCLAVMVFVEFIGRRRRR